MINENRGKMFLPILLLLLLVGGSGETAVYAAGLFSDYSGVGVEPSPKPTIVRSRLVSVDLDQLRAASPAQSLVLNLFEDISLIAVLDRIEHNSSGSYSWIGHLEGNPFGQVTLVVNDKIVIGNISLFKALYAIRVSAEGVQVIHEIDPSKFPAD